MSIFSGLEKIVEADYAIGKHTWYGLGGPADYFIRPQTVEQLQEVVERCNENDIPYYVLGFGSNVLIGDGGIHAAVIKLQGEQFTQTEFVSDGSGLVAWAGADMRKLVRACVEKGLSGLEALTGIPSSVGGAVKMNAGGRFGDIGTVIESVTLMDSQGKIFEKSKPELVFDYRQTNIGAKFILNANVKLSEGDPDQILRTVKEVWIYKENNQPPLNTKNSGCIFKNPRGVSAGVLIDRAGLKGQRIGGAVVSEKHANFILAEKDCTSHDILQLISMIKDKVRKELDTELELEIEVWE
jgi:UDP-N-acetylmuramate dehydrogenase